MKDGQRRFEAAAAVTAGLLACILMVIVQAQRGLGQQHISTERDGQHDFDFEIGTWKTHLSRRVHPLTGSNSWVEYEGTTFVRGVWSGRANLVELKANRPFGPLRRFEPASVQSPIASMEPQFRQQQRRRLEPTHDRRV